MSRQIRLNGKFVHKSKANKVKRIQEGFKRFDLLRKPESAGVINVEQETRQTPPTNVNSIGTSETSPVQNDIIDSGRRIVELGHIAKQLFCEDCKKPLPLQNTVHERKHGYGSVLMIECECGSCREVIS